jgi:hypothetical protein
MTDQWPRALLRAALREAGYDAVGARSIEEAASLPAREPGRGRVALIVLEHDALGDVTVKEVERLLAQFDGPPVIYIASATVSEMSGPWRHVLKRPVGLDEIVREVQCVLPLASAERRPLD